MTAAVALDLAPPAYAQTATGAITGRVQSGATGNYLNNARIRVAGTTNEAFTNSFGEYRLNGVAPGSVTLEVFFTGMAPQAVTVTVPASGEAQQDVVLQDANATGPNSTVVMSQYVVQSQRETDATAIAINEQRFAPNRMDVVSTDAFGEINQGNVGEFLKFLPGVSLDTKDGNIPTGIMVRGFDTNYTNVTMDGGQLASTNIANTQTMSRQFVLDGANINNLARIELVKLPTPDMSANVLGGSVNFVSRSAFERSRRELRISAYLSANAHKMEFDKSPGPIGEDTYKILPSFDLQFADPVTKNFGYVITLAQSSQFYLQNKSVLGHRFTSGGATPANPYTTNVNTSFTPNRNDRTSGAITLDWKPFPRNVLHLSMQANASRQQQAGRTISYNVGNGTPTSWDEHNTVGAATGASVGLSTGTFQSRHALARAINGSWTFTGSLWKTEVAGSWSHSNNRVRDTAKGLFNSVSVSLPNVGRVVLHDIDSSTAKFGAAEVYDTSGNRLDELSLANYNLTQVNSQPMDSIDLIKEARVNITRQFSLFNVPLSVKIGGSINDWARDIDYTTASWNYVGKDGLQNSSDDRMGNLISDDDIGVSPGFGRPAPQWPSVFKVFDLWKNQPQLWQYTASQAGDTVRNHAIRSPWFHETVTSGYAMADAKFLRNRLRLVAGVRYELTDDEGRGYKQDADAVLLHDAQGNIVYTTNATTGARTGVIRPELLPSGSGAYNSVLYTPRAYYNSRDYAYFFPSAHLTYNLLENLQFRAEFARTMGRPPLNNIVPNLFVQENLNFGVSGVSGSSVPGFITGANTGLKPWTAKNYDYTVEYYLPRNGIVMVNAYRKDITNFFGTTTQIADEALLQQLGVGSDALGYQYTRAINLSNARIQGWEARIDLPLANLAQFPALAGVSERLGLQHYMVTANLTHLDLSGSSITSRDWKRYIPRSRNFGFRYNFPKVSGVIMANFRGKMLRDTANQFPGANEYIRARWQIDGDLSYQITKQYSVFFAGRNLLNAPSEWEVSGPGVPQWATITNYEDYGAQYSLGVRGVW